MAHESSKCERHPAPLYVEQESVCERLPDLSATVNPAFKLHAYQQHEQANSSVTARASFIHHGGRSASVTSATGLKTL